jgi:hypothetical protein
VFKCLTVLVSLNLRNLEFWEAFINIQFQIPTSHVASCSVSQYRALVLLKNGVSLVWRVDRSDSASAQLICDDWLRISVVLSVWELIHIKYIRCGTVKTHGTED